MLENIIEWWNGLCLTDRLLVGFGLAFGVSDIVLAKARKLPTYSKRILKISKEHSAGLLIPLLTGLVIGHLFWPQVRPAVPVEPPAITADANSIEE